MVIVYLLVIFYLAFSFVKGIINIELSLLNITLQIIKLCAIIGILIIILKCWYGYSIYCIMVYRGE